MSAKQAELPPVMILCGGQGTRLRDLTELLPKPMVPIGEQPVLWHIMRGFAAFGCRRFILCLGYKREEFIDYFLNFQARSCDMTITLGRKNGIVYHGSSAEADWEVTLADTGIDTMTGGRVLRASRYLKPQDREFFLTYGDGVADIDVAALLEFHRRNGKQLTVSAVHPEGRFGEMQLDDRGGNHWIHRKESAQRRAGQRRFHGAGAGFCRPLPGGARGLLFRAAADGRGAAGRRDGRVPARGFLAVHGYAARAPYPE